MAIYELDKSRVPALGVVEFNSIARGVLANDAMLKKAKIRTLRSGSICPGKYLILIDGEVEEVEQAMKIGCYYGSHYVVDKLFLPHVHPLVLPAIHGVAKVEELLTAAIVETFTVAGTILGADAACKSADIELLDMHLAAGLGGKAYFTFTGEQHMVEAAIEGVFEKVDGGMIVRAEIIPAPHEDLNDILL